MPNSMWAAAKTMKISGLLSAKDKSTQEGRSIERYRRISLTAVASAVSRATSLLTMLVSVRLVVNHFGAERYALWATITSTAAILVFADFGIGNGLLNSISESDGKENREAALEYVSSGFFVLFAIALFGAACLGITYSLVPWYRIFNVTSDVAVREAGPATAIFIVCFLAQLPLGVVQRVQLGYQEGFVTQLWTAGANLLALLGLLLVIQFRAGLPALVAAFAGAPVFAGVLNTAIEFGAHKRWLKPKLALVTREATRKVLQLGFLFFLMQVAGAVGYQTDNLIIAQVMGAAAVTQYAVPFRLFAIVPGIVSLAIAPLWPAYAEASSRGDIRWVKSTLKRSLRVGLALTVPANLLLILAARGIIHAWVGPQITPPLVLLAGLGTWAVFSGVSGPLAMFLNGVGFIRAQAICSVFMAITNVGLSVYLTHHIGTSGVIYGSIVSQVVFIFIPYGLMLPRLLDSLKHNSTISRHITTEQVACN